MFPVSSILWTKVSSKSNTKEYVYFDLSIGGKKGDLGFKLNEEFN